MADYKTLSGLDLDIGGFTESVTRSRKTLEEVSRKNRGIGAKPEIETVELDNNFLEGIAQLFRDNGYEPKQPSEDTTTTPKDEVLEEYSKLMKSEIIQDAMKELSTLGESPNKLEDIYTSMDTDFVTLENQPTVDSEGDTLDIRQTEPLGLMSKVSPVVTSDKPIMAETPSQPDLKADVDSEILSPRFLNAIGITASLTEKGVQTEVKKVLKEQGMSDEDITNLVNKSLAAIEVQPTDGKDSQDMTVSKIKTDFVEGYLAGHEGTKDHGSKEDGGKTITRAYGVKNSLGLNRSDYNSDKDFAAAVALKHYEETERKIKTPKVDKFGRSRDNSYVWADLGEAGRYALTDLHYNAGTIGSSAADGNAKDAITNTLNYIIMTTKDKTKVSLVSLAKRRAENWNKAADELGLTKIDKIQQMLREGGGTIMKYLDSEGNVVHKVSTSRIPVTLKEDGDYDVLTTTREEEIN